MDQCLVSAKLIHRSESSLLLYRQVPVSGLLKFISSVTGRKARNMSKLQRKHEDIAQLRSSCSTLTILQWNVLADGLAQHGNFERVRALLVGSTLSKCLVLQ